MVGEAFGLPLPSSSPGGGGGGIIVQRRETTKTDTFSEAVPTASASGDITGLTVSITPSSVSNDVEVSVSVTLGGPTSMPIGAVLYRNGSPIVVGAAASPRVQVTAALLITNAVAPQTLTFTVTDSPTTTSPVIYSVRLRHGSGSTQTLYVNRSATDGANVVYFRAASTIIAKEISS